MGKGRISQLKSYVKKARTAEVEGAEGKEEIRFRMSADTLAPKLQESAIKITHLLFRKEFPDYQEAPEQYPDRFYEIGNIVLAYLAEKMPDVIEPFESPRTEEHPEPLLPYPENEEVVIERARNRGKKLLDSNRSFIESNQDAFKLFDIYMDIFQQGRKCVTDSLDNLGIPFQK